MALPQEEIKRRIAAARLIRGMSQAEFDALGAADGFGKGEMSRVERGELQFREGKHRDAMCRYLDVPAWWFTADTIDMTRASDVQDGNDVRAARMEEQLAAHAAQVEQLIEQQNGLLARQSQILEGIEAAIRRDEEAVQARAAAEDEWVERVVTRAREALSTDTQSQGSARRKPAKSATPRG